MYVVAYLSMYYTYRDLSVKSIRIIFLNFFKKKTADAFRICSYYCS